MEISSILNLLGEVLFLYTLGATAVLFFTKGKLLILASAAISVVYKATWFNHFEVFNIVTVPDATTLSIYLLVTGRSKLSIGILNLCLLVIAR